MVDKAAVADELGACGRKTPRRLSCIILSAVTCAGDNIVAAAHYFHSALCTSPKPAVAVA